MSLDLLKPITSIIHFGKKEIKTKLWYTHFDTVRDFYTEIYEYCKEFKINCSKNIKVVLNNRVLNMGESCTIFWKKETIDIFI